MRPFTDEEIKAIQPKILELITEVERISTKYDLNYSLAYGSILGAVRHNGFIPWDSDMDIIIPIDDVPYFRECFKKELPDHMCIHEWDKEDNYHPSFDRIAFKDLPHEIYHVDVFQLIGLPSDLKKRKRFISRCYYTSHILSCKVKNTDYSRDRNVWKIKVIKAFLSVVPIRSIKKAYWNVQHKYPYKDASDVYVMTSNYRTDFTSKQDLLDVVRVPFESITLPIPKKYDEYLTHIYGDYMTPRRDW